MYVYQGAVKAFTKQTVQAENLKFIGTQIRRAFVALYFTTTVSGDVEQAVTSAQPHISTTERERVILHQAAEEV